MSTSPQSSASEPTRLDAVSAGVSAVLDGPASDKLDGLERQVYEETRLRCELLRAQIRAVDREASVKEFLVRHIVLRNHCILVATLMGFGCNLAIAAQPQPAMLSAVVAVITATLLAGSKALTGRFHDKERQGPPRG